MRNNQNYIFSALNVLLISISLCVVSVTDFNGIAALIYILPMVLESMQETTKKKDFVIEMIIDLVALITSSITTIIVIILLLHGPYITETLVKWLMLSYPFYKGFQAVNFYINREG